MTHTPNIFYVDRCVGREDGQWFVTYKDHAKVLRSAVSLTKLEVGQRFTLEGGRAAPADRVRHG